MFVHLLPELCERAVKQVKPAEELWLKWSNGDGKAHPPSIHVTCWSYSVHVCTNAAVCGYYLLWQSLSLCVWKQIIAPHSQRWHLRLLPSEGFAALYMISSVGKCHPSKPYKWSVNHNPIFRRQSELIHDCFVRETCNFFGVGNTTICTISGSLQAQNTYHCESYPLGKKWQGVNHLQPPGGRQNVTSLKLLL